MPRFMLLLRNDENAAIGEPPQELHAAIGESVLRWTAEGVLISTGGLAPTGASTMVRLGGGALATERGPFTDDKESVTGYALLRVDSEQDAIARATEFLELYQLLWPAWQGAAEVRHVVAGPDD